jgi:hypothetical protein
LGPRVVGTPTHIASSVFLYSPPSFPLWVPE